MNAAVAFTALCAVLVAALLASERRNSRRGIYAAKPAAAACFLVVAFLHQLGKSGWSPYAVAVVVGLCFGAAGDVALMLRTRRTLQIGLVLFLIGHLAYLAAFALLVPPSQWVSIAALLPVAAAMVALTWLTPHLNKMRAAVLAYIAGITAMVIGALAVLAHAPLPELTLGGARLLALGAALFFISDIAVARQRFVVVSFRNKIWGQPAYFAAQLLIAWSLSASA